MPLAAAIAAATFEGMKTFEELPKDQQREIMKRMHEGYEYLEQERREKVRQTDTAQSIDLLDDAFESAIWLQPEPRQTSGMVAQQAIFARARR